MRGHQGLGRYVLHQSYHGIHNATESVLGRVHKGDIVMNLELGTLFIEAYGHLHELINHVAEGSLA